MVFVWVATEIDFHSPDSPCLKLCVETGAITDYQHGLCSCPSQANFHIYKSFSVPNISLLRNCLQSSPATKSFARTKIHYFVLLEMSNLKNNFRKLINPQMGLRVNHTATIVIECVDYLLSNIDCSVCEMPENSEKYPKL